MEEWEGKSPRIADNFRREHFLPETQMVALMCCIIENGVPVYNEKDATLKRMRGNQLKGGEIKVSPKWVGFAIPEKVYKNYLIVHHHDELGLDDDEFEKMFDRLVEGEKYEELLDSLFKPEDYLLWVTWDNDGDNPFPSQMSESREKVRNVLGLDKIYIEQNVLLFFVDVDKLKKRNGNLFRPTFCDADLGEHFCPAPVGFISHGITWPLNLNREKYSEEEHLKKGRPEAVMRSKFLALNTVEKMIRL
ncbi:MAG: hypothetical protein LBJ23_04310 [Tannerella sp.]|nr:hypothetical protein [Tannerella sp.]